MPTYDEAKQIHKSATEAQRRDKERARKKKYNPDGTLRKAFEEGYHTKSK